MIIWSAKIIALMVLLILGAYAVRHIVIALRRLFGPRRMNYMDLAGYHQPRLSVLLPMHNEEAVAPDVLEALAESNYPREKGLLEVIPINDHSTDRTGKILDEYARRYSWIRPIHRMNGVRGKAAALQLATGVAKGEIIIVFDADYIPGKSLLHFLAAPFADPGVGAVMGRVIPCNVGNSLLTRLLDLERAGGYQIGQQARHDMGMIVQFGGTVGGVRRAALDAVGGWNPGSLTEDTDLTLRLVCQGWQVVYINRAECYEEVPETWEARRRQIERWAIGHTDCMHRYLGSLLRTPHLGWLGKLDGLFLLCSYWTAPLILAGWLASAIFFFSGGSYLLPLSVFFLASTSFNTFGNLGSFLEIGSSGILDAVEKRLLLLPLNLLNFMFSTTTIIAALGKYYWRRAQGLPAWEKTQRFRHIDQGSAEAGAPVKRGLESVRAKAAASGSDRD